MPDRNMTVPMAHGYNLNLGVDSLTLDAKDRVVDGAATQTTGGGGSTSKFHMTRIQSTEDLMQTLGLDINVSVGSAFFGAGASDAFSFAKSQKIQSNSLFMAVTANVESPDLSIDVPVLTDDAQRCSDPATFHTRYGDMFVKTAVRGGMFTGILKMDTQSSTDADAINDQLKGSYGLVVSADVSAKINSVASKYNCSIEVDMFSIGGPVMQQPTRADALIDCVSEFLQAFETNADANAKYFQVVLAPVQDALAPAPPNAVDVQKAQDILTFCARRRFEELDSLNLISDCVTIPADMTSRPTSPPPTPSNYPTRCSPTLT
jgi:hypothetical protein